MSRALEAAYNTVPYPSLSFPYTHPDRLATLATMFGMQPAPVEQCRVLELGCGDGNNLLPMAYALPESTFVGVDIAAQPIADGTKRIEELGLTNFTLHALDLSDVGDDFGTFDYIIAHGVYSWVPAYVRDRLMAVCQARLAPEGVAFISYNVLPGGYMRRMAREMMRYHVRELDDDYDRVAQARAVLHFLIEGQVHQKDHPYRKALEQEFDRIDACSDEVLIHSALADVNDPFYFHEFAAHAEEHGLQFLAEAEYLLMQDHMLSEQAQQTLQQLEANPLEREQYLDFLHGRVFRQTLLCRQARALQRPPRPETVTACYAGAPIKQVPVQGDAKPGAERFTGMAEQATVQTSHPLSKAVFHALSDAWPHYVSFETLHEVVRETWEQQNGDVPEASQTREMLGVMLLDLYGDHFLSLHSYQPHFVTEVGPQPEASAVARLQARSSSVVANQVHYSIQLRSPAERRLLRLLDGTREAPDLADAVNEGQDEEPVDDDWVWDTLEHFADNALLVG